MKSWDIQDALSSVAEVAIFAWSLLELLLTRVLPLAAFFAGHLLLQFGSVLTSLVTPAPRRHKPRRAEYNSWDVAQAEELIAEDQNVQAVNEDGDDQKTSESLKLSTDEELEERQRIISGLILPSLIEDEEEGVDAAATSAVYQRVEPPKEEVSGLQNTANEENVTDLQNTANEREAPGGSDAWLAESSPSDVQKSDLCLPSDVSDNNKDAELSRPDVVGVEEKHVSPKEEGSAGKMDLKPSDMEVSEEATSPGEVLMRKSSGRRKRVLPPSLSQVKRSLMQRSRRASPSPHTTSPATTAPSPSPFQKQQRSSRRSASPAIRRASSSFLQKFRNHFLLDAAT